MSDEPISVASDPNANVAPVDGATAPPAINPVAQDALNSINELHALQQARLLAQQRQAELDLIATPILRLDDMCVQVIAENFQDYPVLDKIPPQYLDSVVSILDPSRIALEVAAKYIESEKFWKRMCQRWSNCQPEHHGSSWKRLYLERNLEELLESYAPLNEADFEDDTTASTSSSSGMSSSLSSASLMGGGALSASPSMASLMGGASASSLTPKQRARLQAQEQYEKFVREVAASKSLVHTLRVKQLLSHLNLYELFRDFPNLSTLDLTYSAKNVGMDYAKSTFGMKLADAASLAQLLMTTKTLNRLVLTQNLLTDDSIQVLMGGLTKNETLTALDLSHNKIGSLGARRLSKLLDASSTTNVLMSLSLADNGIHEDGARFLAKALANNQTLTALDLRLNMVGEDGGIALFDSLRMNQSLEWLNLSANQLGVQAGRALAAALPANRTLRELNLSANRIADDDGGAALAAVLIAHPSLTSVDLRRSEVADAQVAEIRKATARREVELRRERRKRFQNLGQAFESMHL